MESRPAPRRHLPLDDPGIAASPPSTQRRTSARRAPPPRSSQD